MRFSNELAGESSFPERKVQHKCNDYNIVSTTTELRTPQKEVGLANGTECLAVSPIPEDWRTPLANLTNTNSSARKDWRVSSGEKLETLRQPRKLKRLRRLGDCSSAVKENNPGITEADHIRSRSRGKKHIRGNWFCIFFYYIEMIWELTMTENLRILMLLNITRISPVYVCIPIGLID